MKTRKHSHSAHSAFTLVEVSLAMGVASFCLLSVLGLVPVGITSNQNASEQTAAVGIATAISADFHGTHTVSTSSVSTTTSRFGFVIPTAGGSSVQTLFFTQDGTPIESQPLAQGAAVAATIAHPPRYRATVTCQAEDGTSTVPASPTPRNKTFKVRVQLTWPALADPTTAPPSNFLGSLETLSALNCN
jgi:uncharacterized protein (TIGR02598 family)